MVKFYRVQIVDTLLFKLLNALYPGPRFIRLFVTQYSFAAKEDTRADFRLLTERILTVRCIVYTNSCSLTGRQNADIT